MTVTGSSPWQTPTGEGSPGSSYYMAARRIGKCLRVGEGARQQLSSGPI